MTNQEKDLKNAREYFTQLNKNDGTKLSSDEIEALVYVSNNYVQHLESKGKIKFTENRFKSTECVRCGQELWLKDSDAGTDKELLRLCHVCVDNHEDKTL